MPPTGKKLEAATRWDGKSLKDVSLRYRVVGINEHLCIARNGSIGIMADGAGDFQNGLGGSEEGSGISKAFVPYQSKSLLMRMVLVKTTVRSQMGKRVGLAKCAAEANEPIGIGRRNGDGLQGVAFGIEPEVQECYHRQGQLPVDSVTEKVDPLGAVGVAVSINVNRHLPQ
jgi:hypothetical protein